MKHLKLQPKSPFNREETYKGASSEQGENVLSVKLWFEKGKGYIAHFIVVKRELSNGFVSESFMMYQAPSCKILVTPCARRNSKVLAQAAAQVDEKLDVIFKAHAQGSSMSVIGLMMAEALDADARDKVRMRGV